MSRPTLKLPPGAAPTSSAKPPSGRALRAHHGRPPQPAAKAAESDPTAAKVPASPMPSASLPKSQRRPRPAAPGHASKASAKPAARPAPRPFVAPKAAPSRNPAAAADPDLPRLSKRMGELGLCSRREADEWIVNGWVRVDGVVVDTLGTRVAPDARIEIDAAAHRQQRESVTILLHKPVGYVSGQAEDGYEPAMVLIRPENRWTEDRTPIKWQPGHLRGLAPAGRLDIDSTGLLVFTQDGRVAKRLIGHDTEIEKEYLVRVEGTLDDTGLKRLNHGLSLDGEALKPARVSWQNEHQLRFVLRQGKKRQIRRMCELVGLTVTGLKRVRTGSVPLGRLPAGMWRYLRRDETF
jgi:23S rRNA pseudouridine2604 synthase